MNTKNNKDDKSSGDKRENTIQTYRQWLEKYSWDWFGTLKVDSGMPSIRRAKKMCDDYISNLRQAEGDEDFRFFRVLERGTGGSNLHFHLLIGGLRDRRKVWEQNWKGDALLSEYKADQKGLLYVLKSMDNRGDLDCDFTLPPGSRTISQVTKTFPLRASSTPTCLRVDGIDGETTVLELRRLFKPYGRVIEVEILATRDAGRTVMSALVTMAGLYAAQNAAQQLDAEELRGWPIRVRVVES
jgi:RNA recognition motif. (a.k.a. RRM, RBD, or RNP domain)